MQSYTHIEPTNYRRGQDQRSSLAFSVIGNQFIPVICYRIQSGRSVEC